MAQKIKFVTDSASDIPRSLREELDILVLPFPIAMGAGSIRTALILPPLNFMICCWRHPTSPPMPS